MNHILVRYHEIGLKGKNRPFFINQLISNLRAVLAHIPGTAVRRDHSQVIVDVPEDVNRGEVTSAISRVFGIAKFTLAQKISRDLPEVKEGIRSLLDVEQRVFDSFRVTASRADKRYPLTSMDLNRELGSFIHDLTGARVDLHKPDLTVYVDIQNKEAYLYLDPIAGPGGLPVGSSGHVAVLLSGGIDSPVAAHRMLQRGSTVSFIHFHSFPLVDGSSRDKAHELVQALDRYQLGSRLHLVPFADIQKQIIATVPPPYRVVAYRRFMIRVAEAIAQRDGALALVTGESVGQVASQTLENIATVDAVARMPVLRPLIGMDKVEIIDHARRIDTYSISIKPDEDCCSLFVPRHPILRATPWEAERVEEGLDIDALVRLGTDQSETIDFGEPRGVHVAPHHGRMGTDRPALAPR